MLYRPCSTDRFDFETTAELEPLTEVIGQDRAREAVEFGISIRRPGYNIFAFGPPGSGKRTTIEHFLGRAARGIPEPDDWCYVHNFELPHKPRALRLPTGWGARFAADMTKLVEDLRESLPQVFDSEPFYNRRDRLMAGFEERKREQVESVGESAKERGLRLVQGDEGLMVAPLQESGEVMSPEAFHALPEEEQKALRERMSATDEQLAAALRSLRAIDREAREAYEELQRTVAEEEVVDRLAPLRARYAEIEAVLEHLEAVRGDVLEHLPLFGRREEPSETKAEGGSRGPAAAAMRAGGGERRFRRYSVNVLVDGSRQAGAPVVVETYPTLPNLVGRIEQEQRLGALVTDFSLIKPGALHMANGGFLILEMEELIGHPWAWEAIKRALKTGRVHIEPPAEPGNTMTTIQLDPEPIELDCKVLLIGDAGLYLAFVRGDPDFPELFKVGAEFGHDMARYPSGCRLYARFIRTVGEREDILPFDRGAVSRVVEHGSRLVEDSQRLSANFLDITNLLREADYWSRRAGHDIIEREDVEQALRAAERRADLAREQLYEEYARGTFLVDTRGEEVGQVNALTVVSRGDFAFGMPVRVSARVRQGNGAVIDIEREVELGGPLHSKGVLILSGFLASRYLQDEPPSMEASLTFEQSYGRVDGDSASSTELYALVSALSGLPVRQDLAVTGAISQSGDVQSIGGVNEKIEGFFDICQQDGLTGNQGVLIPASNVDNLMVREDVVQAVAAGQFHIYPIAHVDEGLALLLGREAGSRQENGDYPADSINRLAEERMRRFAESRQGDDRRGARRIRPRRRES